MKQPKILHYSTYDNFGGAARAASRIVDAQVKNGMDSRLITLVKRTELPYVSAADPIDPKTRLKLIHDYLIYLRTYSDGTNLLSDGEMSAGLAENINRSDGDIVNLHWISYMFSIEDIAKLKKPLVWTFHDMWPLCGTEHYVDHDNIHFYLDEEKVFYSKDTNQKMNRDKWMKKLKCWNNLSFSIVCPSKWLTDLSGKSPLFKKSKFYHIPCPIDINFWKPVSKESARQQLGFASDKKLILFSAQQGTTNNLKGWNYLLSSLQILEQDAIGIELIVTGTEKDDVINCPFNIYWQGKIDDDVMMKNIYGAADIVVVPSRMESFSQVTLEAQSCGIPVAAFDIGGPGEIVKDKLTGWLAKPFDINDLAKGIRWIVEDNMRWNEMSAASRKNVLKNYSPDIIAQMYTVVYEAAIENAT